MKSNTSENITKFAVASSCVLLCRVDSAPNRIKFLLEKEVTILKKLVSSALF